MAPPKTRKDTDLKVNAHWEYAKWWHKLIRRKTVYFQIDGYPTISFDGKGWRSSAISPLLSKSSTWKFQEKKK